MQIMKSIKINLQNIAAFGVAGNFTGHLEQAGEARDFANVKTEEANAPKALFPTYIPLKSPKTQITPQFLSIFPFDSKTILYPAGEEKLQIEPECAIICQLEWKDNRVVDLKPFAFGASNDCSIRKDGAKKISQKKNWGKCSKGLSDNLLPIDSFTGDGILGSYRIASFLLRPKAENAATFDIFDYGEDSPVSGYSYIYAKLVDWLINKLNNQKDEGPAENINAYLAEAGCPEQVMISVGATRYTDFGETNFLQTGDLSAVVVYDQKLYSHQQIANLLTDGKIESAENVSALVQKVTCAE